MRSQAAGANPEDSVFMIINVLRSLSLLQLLAPGRQDYRTVEVLDMPKFLSPVLATFGLEGAQSHMSTCLRACPMLSHLAVDLLDSGCVQAYSSKGAL